MLQTDRKTETARQTLQNREQARRQKEPEAGREASQALEAILNGAGWKLLPAEGMLALSHRMGNDALVSLLSLRPGGPETETAALPGGPCLTEAGDWGGGEAAAALAPVFTSFAPMAASAPLAL